MAKTWKRYLLGALLLLVTAAALLLELQIRREGLGPSTGRVSINWYHGAENLKPVIDAFTRETGVVVEVIDSYDIYNTDVMLISDVGTLVHAKRNGYLSYLRTEQRDAVVPQAYRDRDGYWYGALLRARSVAYSAQRVKPEELRSWEDLADPKWKGRICLRRSSNVYNRSLVAMMLIDWGTERTERWIRGLLDNLKDAPDHRYASDTENMRRVAAGECDLTILNTYYIGYAAHGRFGPALVEPAQAVRVKWFDDAFGTPMNVTGIGINPGSRHRAEAERLVDFLLGQRGQALISEHVFKYPVRGDAAAGAWVASLGQFKRHEVDLNRLEGFYGQAVSLMESQGWQGDTLPDLPRSLAQRRQRIAPFNPVLYP
jgi:iron(III) transport system substrate-binding protein